jgi:hypothetical protein
MLVIIVAINPNVLNFLEHSREGKLNKEGWAAYAP